MLLRSAIAFVNNAKGRHMRPYLVLLVLWCGTVFSDEFHSEKIAPGDIQHLKQAILDANDREMRTALTLSGTYTFTAADELPAIHSTISMWGDPNDYFRFQGASEVGPNRMLTIESDGELTVGYGEFTKFDVLRLSGSVSEVSPLIENHGSLVLDQAVFRDIDGSYFITRTHFTPPLISNFGSFLAKRTSFINSGFNQGLGGLISNLGFARFEKSVFDSTNIREPISNEGEMELVNVSYLGNPRDGSGASSPLSNGEEGTVRIGNSIFAGVEGSFWCSQVLSLGHNLVDNAACGLSADGDIIGVPTGLLPLSADPKMREFFLSAASPAIDSGDPELCATVADGPLDGNGDGIAICDRGAFEFYSKGLSDGGANGLYYDPDHDGHYVYVLDNDYNTLVMWNTFDTQGNQAWVLALGDLANGQSMIADAYINKGGTLTASGPTNVSLDNFWGTIQIELDSCKEGTFYFDSVLPNFTKGQFRMKRLAGVTQIGCED